MSKNSSGGIGIATVLFLIFLVLKLTKVITWSWWWVFSPLWISLGVVLVVFVLWALVLIVLNLRIRKGGRR